MSARVVVDTNVIVSALLSEAAARLEAPSLKILQAIDAGAIDLIVSDDILEEYENVLRRPEWKFESTSVHRFISAAGRGERIRPSTRIELGDDDDSRFLECALDGRADYLITGNIKDYPQWSFIVTPRQFVEAELR